MFADDDARELVSRAMDLRAAPPPVATTEAWVDNRTRVRLLLPGQWKWRTRTLYRKEALGQVRFSPAGVPTASILERRRAAPLIGAELLERPETGSAVGFDPEGGAPLFGIFGLELAGVANDQPFVSPSAVRLFDTVLHDPLAPGGLTRYRYARGDDLTTRDGRHLRSVTVRSAGDDPPGIHGLVWFDAETGRPVRALLRPAEELPLRTGLRGLARRIPLIEKDAVGEIDFVLLDYDPAPTSGHRPLGVRVAGAISTFWGQAILPVQSEWTARWDEAASLPPGPPPPFPAAMEFADTRAGLGAFVGELDRLTGPDPAPGPWSVLKAAATSVRFNQVQGLNAQLHYPLPVGARTVLHSRLQIPSSSFEWTGSLGLEHGLVATRSGIELFSHLRDADPLLEVNGALSSITSLVTGYDDGNYFLARGARGWLRFAAQPVSGFASLFIERHERAPRRVFTSLLEPDTTREAPPVLPVTEGTYSGVRVQAQVQVGEDPRRGVLLVRVHGQGALGTREFATVGTTTDLIAPLPGPFTLGLRAEVGVSAGDVPGQGLYYLGGVRTVRGYPAAAAAGPSVLLLNAEVGTDLPLFRLVAFGDVGWTDSFDRLLSKEPLHALGGGLSVADGILRLEVARGLSEAGVWKVHVTTSGIF